MLISGTRQFNCRKQFPFVLFRYQCLYLSSTYSCEMLLCCTTRILYSRPNWYALMKSCINANHYVLLVRRHLKCVVYEVYDILHRGKKMATPLGYSGGFAPWSPYQGLCLWTPAPNLPLHHWPSAGVVHLVSDVVGILRTCWWTPNETCCRWRSTERSWLSSWCRRGCWRPWSRSFVRDQIRCRTLRSDSRGSRHRGECWRRGTHSWRRSTSALLK